MKDIDLRKGKVIEIKCDTTKSYYYKSDAVEDAGFIYTGEEIGNIRVFKKDDKEYFLKSVDHFNTTIYSIKIKELIRKC